MSPLLLWLIVGVLALLVSVFRPGWAVGAWVVALLLVGVPPALVGVFAGVVLAGLGAGRLVHRRRSA